MANPIFLRYLPNLSKLLFFRGQKAKLGYVQIGDNLSIDADGVLSATPSRRIETYFGTTDGNGDYSVTYAPAFTEIPCVLPDLISTANSQTWRISDSTVNGFTVRVEQRSSVDVLGVQVVGFTTTPVSGAELNVTVMERD